MSQHDYNLANQSGASFRSDLNNALDAIVTLNSGGSAPATTFARMLWADTTNNLLKQRNAANSAWIVRNNMAETFLLARSSDTVVGVADFGRMLVCTSTFTQTLTAAATLGDGFVFYIRNDGVGVITIDPNASEQIDGATTIALQPGESCAVYCNGTSFKTVGRVNSATLSGLLAMTGGKLHIPIPASSLTPRSANGCAALATTNGAANQPDVEYLAFDGAAKEYARASFTLPASYDGGTITLRFAWRRASGSGAANVVWGGHAVCVADNETPAVNFGSDATVTDDAKTTTANFSISGDTGALTIAGTPAGGKKMFLEVFRDGASGSDTLDAVDAWLSEVVMVIGVNKLTDA